MQNPQNNGGGGVVSNGGVAAQVPQGGGGVAMQLDYDITMMSEFCSWVVFSLFKCMNNMASPHFQSLLNSVLTATRLPKSTVLLGIHYVSKKLETETEPCFNESKIFETLIMGLLLANKFNDDNTFKNRSWADATGLNLEKINILERDWLKNCLWKLYDDSQYGVVESCWLTWCMRFDNNAPLLTEEVVPPPPSQFYYNNSADEYSNRTFSMNTKVSSSSPLSVSAASANTSNYYFMNQPQPIYGAGYQNNSNNYSCYNNNNFSNYYVPPMQSLPLPIQQFPVQLPNFSHPYQQQQQPYFNYYGYAAVY